LGNWLELGIPVIAVVILSITIVTISAEESLIPIWIKVIAEFWVGGELSDKEFISAMEWLIENRFIKISNTDDGGWKNEADKLFRENKRLADEILELKNENRDLRKELGKSTIITTSKPTEFGYPSWLGGKPINIGGITIYINEFGYMSHSGDYFGVDMTLEYTRGGNPINLVVTNVSIIDEKGFVFDADDSEFTKFAGMYSESKRRGLVLFENLPKDFNELDIVVTVIDKHVVDDSYTFTFPYTFYN